MGVLWRLFAPKPLKKARRSARKATHPVRTLTPRPVKQVRRAGFHATHPWEAVEHGTENRIVHALRGGRGPAGHGSPVVAADGATSAQVRAWARRSGCQVADKGRLPGYVVDAYNRSR
ncbi:histone-like nucleoid-structuring protein Lsr2 [Streptacidiphilus sp. EB129]|uniref:Lsr2 family DNA-binding protein n=1 Tax=Streptacidiphilus sp. EB129 TaxID=3156262 RepID=UPI003512F0DF